MGLLSGAATVGAEGLTATGSRFLHQGAPDIGGTATADDFFGSAVAAGDFDGNGWDDVAIGIPHRDEFGLEDIGVVLVVYHDGSGVLRTERAGAPDWVPFLFGRSLAAGDFNGDAIDDLAVGSYPTEDCGDCFLVAEMIYLFPGTSEGLDFFEYHRLDSSQQFFSFGFVAGDFYGNGFDALATRGWDGLGTLTISWWEFPFDAFFGPSDDKTLPGGAASLAAGDVNGDGADELAVGTPLAPVSGVVGAGSVTVYVPTFGLGTFLGFSEETWNQDTPGIVGGAELNDNFGFSVAFGDTDGDGYDDLFAGVPGEDAAFVDMGAFQRIPGSAGGLTEVGDNLFGAGLAEETGAGAARTIVTGNFEGSDVGVEVAVGVRDDDIGGVADAGSVWIGFSGATTRYWHQDVAGIADSAEADDHFGGIGGLAGSFFPGDMAVGDFNADGADDLVIGIPEEDIGGATDAGAVQILYGTPPNGCAALPDPACLTGFATAKLQVKEKAPGKEAMTANWVKGPALGAPGLGNPLATSGTIYTACLYGDGVLAGSYLVDRAGDTCGTKPCWKSIGGDPPDNKGYKYGDKTGSSAGIRKIQLKAGDVGKSKFSVKGKNNAAKGQTSLPVGVVAALSGSTSVTMQLFGSDVADCFSATLTEIQKDDGLQFKARN